MTEQKAEQTASQEPQSALLVGVYLDKDEQAQCREHVEELQQLADTFGLEVAHTMTCFLRKYDPGTMLTSGKLEEVYEQANKLNVDYIIFDHDLSPAQQRNLEKELKRMVLDRTELIIGVFAQRAHSHEARLQVELAQIRYEAPRLKRLWTHLERQAGTGGAGKYLKGMGEKQLEVDKRLLQKRIDQLQKELKEVRSHRKVQRTARQRGGVPVFGLVGYTNAGKSTILNALTDADVLAEDKLFATLDTTSRRMVLESGQEVILIDTVGFIRKLPHHLIKAFKSTLEEAVEADILIHVIDASHPAAIEHAETTLQVLKELGAHEKPVITVINKIDRPEAAAMAQKLRLTYPRTVLVSAAEGRGFDQLNTLMVSELRKQRTQVTLRIPQSDYAVVSKLIRTATVLSQEYEGNDVILEAELSPAELGQVERFVVVKA